MNNLESAEKKRKRLLEIMAIIIVLCIFLVLVFAANLGEGDGISGDGSATTSVDTNDETDDELNKIEVKGDKKIATVAPGGNFTIALDSEGNVWSWGQNDKGQLGNGTLNDSVSKQPVLLEETDKNGNHIQLSNVKQIAAGLYHAVALTSNGKVYMWGYNYYGQAGSVTKRTELYPQLIDTPNNVTIKEIGAGRDYTVMLTTSGKVLGIGDSTYGQLGYNNSLKFTSIREIEENKSEKELPIIEKVSAGTIHVVALDSNGQVWQWGCDGTNAFDFTSIHQITLNGLEAGEKIQEIEAGVGGRTMALSSNGKVYTWELGDAGPIEPINLDNVQVRTDKEKDNIAIVNSTYYVISTDNKVYSWGINNYGQVGVGNTNSPINVPTELIIDEAVKNKDVDKVSSSSVGLDYHLPTEYAINTEGYVLGWGYAGTDIVDPSYTDGSNNFKLLGDGTRYTANYIGSISVKNIVGDDIVLDITAQGLQAGKDKENVLDVLDNGGYVTGGRVNLYNSSISENSKDSLAIRVIDEDIAKYDNDTGMVIGVSQGKTLIEVASSKNTIYLNVEVIGDNIAFAKIESKDNFTVALKADGTVWAWGYNSYLGIVDPEHSNYTGIVLPVQVKGLENVKDIAVGPNFVLVLKADGTVWGWGYNSNGQLGNGTTDTVSYTSILTSEPNLTQVQRYQIDTVTTDELILMPTPTVKDNSGADVIYAYTENGVEKECYLNDAQDTYTDRNGNIVIKKNTDGKLYKWENGAFKTQEVTRDVIGDHKLENIIAISAGYNYALALDSNGKVWSWGYNGYRQLGLGNTTSNETRAKEVDLTNLTNAEETIKQIEAGRYTSYILTTSGNVYAFGYNGNYQCGMRGNYFIPTRVTTLNRIIKISTSMTGNGNAFALTVNGKVYSFGYNYGYPIMLGLDKVVDISGIYGNYGAIVKFADGTSGYWTGSSVNNNTITKLKLEDGTEFNNVMLIAGSNNYYTVAKTDGTVWTTGSNSTYGQLGNRTTLSVAIPTLKCISYPYMTLSENEITLKVGETSKIDAIYNYGFNLLNTEKEIEVTYTSSNEDIATVKGNVITAKQAGIVYVTAMDIETETKLRVKVNVLAENEVTMPNISVGYTHTVAVKTDGTVWGWGQNSYGELGQTSTSSVKSPTRLSVDEKIKDVAAGYYETLMITVDGKVLAMGYNNYGLGDNTNTTSNIPVTVQKQVIDKDGNVLYVDLEDIVKVTTFEHINLALDNSGKLYAWGYGANGYAKEVNTFGLKVKDITERLILTEDGRVWEYDNSNRIIFKDGLENIVQVSSSAYANSTAYGFYMALDAEGNVYTWVKSTSYGTNFVSGTETTIPTKVEFADEVKIVDIEAGVKVAYAKDEDGNVYTWGNSVRPGTLGLGTSVSSVTVPTKIEALKDIEVMSASKCRSSYNRTFISTNVGTVYGFGQNSNYSLLGNFDTTNYYYEPTQVGQSYLGFVDENGNEITRTSIEKGKQVDVRTSFIDSFNIRNRNTGSAEANCTWRVINADLLSILGENGKGNTIKANNILGEAIVIAEEVDEDGNKTGVYAKLYVDVVEPGTLVAPKMESVGNHTVALKADGTVWAWGSNVNYKNTATIVEPAQIRIAKQVEVQAPIAKVNEDGTLAVDEDGKQIYVYKVNDEEKECYQSGNNYTDLSGKFVVRTDNIDGRLYLWNAEENSFALEDLVDDNGERIVVVDIATSNNHTLLLTSTGDVYSFGYNGNGQLGYSTANTYSYLPQKINDLKDIVKIAVGNSYSLALDKYGNLWTFGYTHYHIITGDSYCYTPINSVAPRQLTTIRNIDLSQNLKNAIDITNEYILTKDGKVFVSGAYSKTLSVGSEVPGITGNVIKVTRTSNSGSGHTAFLTEDGEVFTIGAGAYGQLGNDGYANSNNTAVQVLYGEENSKLTNIRDISVGETHTMAIDKNGKLYTWGHNNNGQLRNSTVEAGVNTARAFEVKSDEKILDSILVSGGNGFTVVVDSTGYAFAWGVGAAGQLGNRLAITSYDAVRVGTEGASLSTNHITLQENGDSASVTGVAKLLNLIYEQAIDVEDAVSNDTNIASTSANKDTDVITINPVKSGTTSIIVKTKSETGKVFENIIQVKVLPAIAEIADDIVLPADRIIEPMTVSGKAHTLILKSDGTVWAYGDNSYGQTGAKDENGRIIKYSDKVTQVEFPEGTASIIGIAAGDAFSVALDAEGNVWTWGYNANGRLGIGSSDLGTHNEPTRVLSNIVKVEAGSSEVIALDKNGYVYTWGKNNGGSLGIIGTNADQYSPARIINIAGAIDIAAGEYHAMILTTDGSVYTTGRNTSGQLGRNVQKSEYFEKVEIGASIAYIEADNRASVAIDTSGKLWVWGENANGQLGLGIDDNKVNEPTQVTTLTEKVESASIGENHIHVVTTNGKLYVAGSNNNGQLGIEKSVQNSNTFRQVTSFGNNVMKSDAGTSYSTVITKDGKVYGFGDYDLERINFTDGYKPVMITNTTLYLDEQEIVVNIDGTHKINANGQYKLNVLHKDNSDLKYSSSNTDIATVDGTGVITGVSVGTVTINVKDEIEGKTSTVLVKVIPTDATQAPTIEGGDKFTIVTNKAGESYAFGNKDNIAKTDIPSIANNSLSFNSVKAGKDFVVAINKDKTVWVWGDNSHSQLGLEDIESTDKMTVLNTNNINNINQIDAGDNHTIALDEFGIVYVWGDNSQGQLGISATEQPIVKQPTVIRPVDDRIISVSAGGNYSAIVDITGTAYIIQNGVARPITGIEGAVKVATGTDYTIVLTNRGIVYRVSNSTPTVKTSLTGISSVVDISVNNDTFMFLASDKTLYTFGSNENGKLGLGKNGSVGSIKNKAAENVFTMGAGYNNTYYINTQGEVLSAGLNTSGELGNGTSTNKDAITFTSSNKYVRIGSQEFELTPKSVRVAPDWKVLVGEEDLKERAEKEEKTKASIIINNANFNVFGNEIIDLDKYDFAIADETIAQISDASILEITARKLGKTILTVTNKVTKEEKELAINVVTEDLLRIENMYINDTVQDFIAEPDSSEDNKFTVNVEGSNPTGTLNIELEFNDTIKVEDEEGNVLTATYNPDTNSYQIAGLDLTKSVQELKITLTSEDGKIYEFTLLIFNELIVKVNDVMLSAQDILNKETLVTEKVFTKYVDPKDTQAKVEISIDNIENKIQLERADGIIVKTTNPAEVLEIADLSLPNIENRFIVKILNASEKVEKQYVLRITKSSIEAIKVNDLGEVVTADRKLSENGEYLEEFTAKINDTNEVANITIELGNKDIATIEIDGVDKTDTISGSKLVISKELEKDEEKTTDVVVKITTNEGYTEQYIIKVSTISSNNNMDYIELTAIGDIPKDSPIKSRKVSDNTYEIVLHDNTANLDEGIRIKAVTESKKATISFNGGTAYLEQGRERALQPKKVTDNQYEVPMIVKAENGDKKVYTLYIYKESENTEISGIKVTGTPSNYEDDAERKEGTNNYVGKVVKTDDGYKLSIELVDEYSTIESITINGEELEGLTGGNGKYTIDIDSDKLGETIEIKVKAEYGNTDTYTLVLEELDNNADFDSVRVDEKVFNNLETDTPLEAQVKSTGAGLLTVKAVSEYATVKVYETNPETDNTASAIASGTGSVEVNIPFNGARTKTLYLEVTSEDGQNKTIRVLNVTKTSNNTNVTSVTVDGISATLDAKDKNKATYTIDVSEATTDATIVVTAEDSNATVQIGENSEKGKAEITMDISDMNEVKFTITSEEGTDKNYTLKLNKLSADTSFTKELQDSNGNIVAEDVEFIQDATDKLKYKVEVLDNLGDIKLVIKPNDANAKVEIKDEAGNVIENGIIPSNVSKNIKVEITSADGNTTTYTIEVVSKHHILETAQVTANSIITTLDETDIANLYKEVRVHPDSTKASIYVEVNSSYRLTAVNANVVYMDKDGNVLHDDIKDEDITASVIGTVSSSRYSTFNVNLLSDKATVQVTMTISTGETQTLTLDIVKGSTVAKLDYVELVGKDSKDTTKQDYTNISTSEMIVVSEDNEFSIEAVAKENGTVKIYKLAEETENWETVDLSTMTEIENKSEITLTGDNSIYVIEVTSEFGGNKARYLLNARKQHNDASLKDLTIKLGNAMSEDENDDIIKKLNDFGKFTYNEETDTYELTAWVPENIDSLSVYDLVADSNAKVEWTDILGTISNDYTQYNTGDIKELSQEELIGNIEKHISIKVTAESGDIKNYCITLKTINSNMSIGDFSVYNVTDDKDVTVENKKAEILQSVEEIKVTGKVNNGAVSLKVLSVNGKTINETIVTSPEFTTKANELSLTLNKDYTYTDDEGIIHTIPKEAVKTIVVERTVKSLGSYLYPDYYDEEVQTDTLTITRLMTDAGITIKYLDNGVEKTIETNDFAEAELDENELVRELTIYLSSAQNQLVINNIKADNEYVKVSHAQKIDNTLYSADAPYTRTISKDKASVTEEIRVATDNKDNDITYRVKFVKLSANNNINEVTVNDYKAQRAADKDEFTHTILASANKLNIGITDIEENATVKMYISAINGSDVTRVDLEVEYSEAVNGVKDATKDIYEQLLQALKETGISKNDLNEIAVKIEVQAEDGEVAVREYTLNIAVVKSNLISINGIDTKGNVNKNAQLLAEDFSNGGNPYSTDIIKVAADVDTVELTDITYTDEEHAVLTDADGNVLISKSLTVNVEDNAITEAKIIIELNGNRQEFVVRIQKKSTDTSIKEVIADEDRTSTIDTETGSYILDIRSTVNPDVQIVLNNKFAKVIEATVENIPNAEVSDIEDNKFTISKVAITRHQDAEVEEPIIVKVKVQAENEATEPQEYTIKLVRRHTETGLVEVKYEYDRNSEVITNTLDYSYTEVQEVQTIPSEVEGVRISEILPVCSKAKAYVQLEDGTREALDTNKLYEVAEGEERTFTIIVEAEYGNEKAYTFRVRRLSSNTEISGVKVNGIDAIFDLKTALYNANIRVDQNADIVITPVNSATTIVGTPKVYIVTEGDLENVEAVNVQDTTFTVEGLLNLYSDDTTEDNSNDVNRYIMVEFVVAAEDTNVTKTYTVKLTRQHIETALSEVAYSYTEVVEATEPDTEATTKLVEETISLNTNDVETILVGSTVEVVNIDKITAVCKNAKVIAIKVDGEEVKQTEDGFNVELPEEVAGDGCIKTVQVFVSAESEEFTASYKFYIARKATNASLSKVIVNNEEAERTDLTEENIEAIYKANVKDTDTSAIIEAISANINATVSIEDEKFTAINNNKIYDEKGTYDLSGATEKEVEVLIKVQPQDENIEAKTYKLIMVRQYNKTALSQITIKPTTEGVEDEAIVKTAEDFKANSCVHEHMRFVENRGWIVDGVTVHTWSEAERIEIPTEWYNIAFSDIIPGEPNITTKVIRINSPRPAHASVIAEYNVDESFVMPEGEEVYFKIVNTAESGATNSGSPYVVTLYKKATSTNATIAVDGTTITADDDGIYKAFTDINDESVRITVTGENNLDVVNTVIKATLSNGEELNIVKKTTQDISKQIIFDLKELDKLDISTDKIVKLTLQLQPEDNNIDPVEYEIEIIRKHTSADIKQVIGNDEEVIIDTQMSHYNYINKEQVDNTIYTMYIDEDVTEVSTDIIAESEYANIYLNEDYETIVGVGKVEGIKVEIADTGITEVKVRLVAEDGKTIKDYRIWYIKKSDDASIKELYVDGVAIPANEDGNYEIKISDTVKSIDVKMIPNYEFANVSINGQPYKWQEVQEIINEYTLKGERVEIKLQVNIPEEQSMSGKAINNTKYLYVNRVSTSNKIAEITTDNYKDSITPGGSPQYNEKTGVNDTYTVNLDGDREFVDLKIVPVSLGATLTIYDLDGNLLTDPSIGTLYLDTIEVNDEDTVTLRVNVAPEEGEAKDYYINIVPKASQAELMKIIAGGNTIDVIPGVYEYPVYDLALPEIGAIEAIAADSQATVNIYTKEHPEGIGENLGSAIVSDVNFEQAIIVQITVMSPNRKNQNTYKLYFKDVSDDSSLQEVSYNVTGNEEDKVIVEMTESSDPNYVGEYVIELDTELENVDIGMIATEAISTINAEELIGNPLEISKDISSMTEDIVIDVVVTAESGSQSLYKVIIKKTTAIVGKVITENYQHNYENVPVQILDNTDAEIATAVTEANGTFEVKVPVGEGYKVVIKKPGYLTYTITDIPVVYGVRTYVGIANLIAGEVAGNDEYIELRDLVQVNKRARVRTSVDDTNVLYDLNEDGIIDYADVEIVTKNYDKTAEKDSTFSFTRYVNIKGLVIDKTGALVPNATIELGNRAMTSETGEFDLADIKIGDYALTVKDSDGNVIGQNNISIVEGNEYVIENSTITISPNTYVVDLQVIVNGSKAIISKRGEEPDEDMIEPTITMEDDAIEFGDNKIKVTVTGEDKNLSSFELYTEDGTLIASKNVSGVEAYEAILEGTITTAFNTTHNLKVVVKDTSGNATEKLLTITDNTIRTAEDLVELSTLVDGRKKNYAGETIKLSSDLDLSGVEFKPIGSSAGKVFRGTFDGNGHTISNININTDKTNVGLFGYVKDATIKNVGIESGNIISTSDYVAGIVGHATGTTTIENCYNKASISGRSYVGGIVGEATGTTEIKNCYNAGDVTGTSNIGGIIGIINAGTVQNCYNIGTVAGEGKVGEIIGFKQVTGANEDIITASVVNCYYLNTDGKGIGEIAKVDTDIEITDTTENTTDSETLLDNLGDGYVSDEYSLNNGYPVLKWQAEAIEPKMMKGRTLRRKDDEDDDEGEIILPVQTEYIITSNFDVREHPVTGEANVMHYGIDIAADWKSEVLSIADGTVTFAGENGGYGYCIEIEHVINGEKVYSFYAHLFEIDVAIGDTITKGQTIGKVGGMPGTPGAGTSTGPHLHLEIRKQSGSYSSAVDPRDYLEF